MKKLLFFVLAAGLLFGCKKDDSTPCPVSGATLPTSSAENPISAGSAVTIQGRGFTASSEIWLRGVATKADGDVQATVTGVTETAITFTAPSVSGEQSVILRQNGGEWPLGKMYFAAASDILPKKIVKVISTYEEPDFEAKTTTKEFSYDESGRLVRIKQVYGDGNEDISTIEYAQGQITIKETDMTTVLHLSNGRIVNSVEEVSDYRYETEFSYGDNGSLAGYVGKAADGSSTDTGTVTVDGTGFLEKISGRYKNENTNGTYTFDFVPNTTVRNNLNLDLMYIGDVLADTDELAAIYGYLLGVCGKRTTYLPQQYTSTWIDEEGTDTWTNKYDYVFDGEYISKIRMSSENVTETYELFYEE